ncbi:hypothetical protein QAD02_022736 [Eretmocerus hayati]|uniref:Uncharacterized protein n=1 Tax=Eretmocerus hayati TaxID=131215 RepID=A0ACC2PU69_9HYME|nr:hypothetical protein QAD02_022736 [Eretmocerus hayati]
MADDDEPLVTITGPALAMLLYENNTIMDQFGFLLGDVQVFVSTKVTDFDRDIEHRKLQINIKSIVAYPISAPFHDRIGQVDRGMVKKFLGDSFDRVVGWYHHRDNFPINVRSARDCVMHRHLSELFSNDLLPKYNFLFYNLTFGESESSGTLKWKQLLYRAENARFKPLSFKIINLGADATRPDGTDYKPIPQISSGTKDAFDQIYNEISNDLQRVQPGINAVNLVQKAAEAYLLKKLLPLIHESDRKLFALEQEVFEIRNKKFREEFENGPWGLAYKMQKMKMDPKQNPKSQDSDSDENMFDSPGGKSTEASSSSRLNTNRSGETKDGSCMMKPQTSDCEFMLTSVRNIFNYLRDNDFESKIRKRSRESDEGIIHCTETSESKIDKRTPLRRSESVPENSVPVRRPGPKSSKINSKWSQSMKDAGDFH